LSVLWRLDLDQPSELRIVCHNLEYGTLGEYLSLACFHLEKLPLLRMSVLQMVAIT
jgi:hypothetical protein